MQRMPEQTTSGSMYGADYTVTYNYGSSYNATVNQSAYYDAWAPIAYSKYRITNVWESDGWGVGYACNGVSGKTVEFDEVKHEI